jgi:polyhydroxyalkanoate synthesis regulator phasin
MADRKPAPQRLPDAVREAVERTLEAMGESAQTTRSRAQEAMDELVRSAEAGAGAVQKRVKEALDERRPVTTDDLRDLRAELRSIDRRLKAIEERLPRPARRSGGRSASSARTRKPRAKK